jgi:Uma2 family endonuclease
MATGQPGKGVGLDESDPYRYGWRYVREVGPDGTETFRQVPLTERDVLHPQEEDFIVQTYGHNRDLVYLDVGFHSQTDTVPGRWVFCDHRIDFGVDGVEPFGPDLAVFDGVPAWDTERGTFPAAEFGAVPLLVVEVTSPSTRNNDLGVKVELYRLCKVPFYAIIDRHAGEDGVGVALWGYRLNGEGLELVEPGEDGRLWLVAVGLWLGIEEGQAVLYDAQGRRLPPPANLRRLVEELTARCAARDEQLRLADERIAAQVEALNVSEEGRLAADRRAAVAEERAAAEAHARRLAEEKAAGEAEARRLAEENAVATEATNKSFEAMIRALQEENRRLKGA